MNIKQYNRNQLFLIPLDLRDWISENHPVWFVMEVVDTLDLTDFYERLREDGRGGKSYDPQMLVGLLLYAYCNGVQSSRQIERLSETDVPFRIMAWNQRVDHTTICRFRKQNERALEGLFAQILELCFESGLGHLGTVALDGTKIAGNASLSENRTRKHLTKEVRRMLSFANQTDAFEDRKYGKDKRGDELPDALRGAERLHRLQEAKARLDASAEKRRAKQAAKLARWEAKKAKRKKRGRRPADPDSLPESNEKANMTDPDSRIMKTRNGFIQGYNGQLVVDAGQLILACDLTQDGNDCHQLVPMLEQAERNCAQFTGQRIGNFLADSGYLSEENLKIVYARDQHPELYLPASSAKRRLLAEKKRSEEDGQPTANVTGPDSRKGKKKETAKQKKRACNLPLTIAMEEKVRSEEGKKVYAQRGWIVEGVNGQIKHGRGLNRFSRRGLSACRSEWSLFCSSHNLMKLYTALKKFLIWIVAITLNCAQNREQLCTV